MGKVRRGLATLARALLLGAVYRAGKGSVSLDRRARRGALAIAIAFLLSVCGSIALAVVYAFGGMPQLEGAMLFVALGGISVGLVQWSKKLMPQDEVVQGREVLLGNVAERHAAEEAFSKGAAEIGRRRFLGRLLGGAVAAFGAAMLFPIRSFGTRPGASLLRTSWRKGVRAVTPDGTPVRASDLLENTVLVIYPEGATEAADSQAVLIKTPTGVLHPLRGREAWSPEGIVVFSRICTHAGCPVGLYQAESAELYCPCHQSVFLVSESAKPISGPATRALPQLPISLDENGYVVADGDFPEPVGPEFWRFGRR